MNSYYFWLIVFAFAAYFIVTDNSVAAAFYYLMKLLKVEYEKQKWWLWNNPKTPWAKFIMWRRSMKMAEELMKEFEDKNK